MVNSKIMLAVLALNCCYEFARLLSYNIFAGFKGVTHSTRLGSHTKERLHQFSSFEKFHEIVDRFDYIIIQLEIRKTPIHC